MSVSYDNVAAMVNDMAVQASYMRTSLRNIQSLVLTNKSDMNIDGHIGEQFKKDILNQIDMALGRSEGFIW